MEIPSFCEDLTVFTERQGHDTGVFGGTDGFARDRGGFGADHAFVVGYMRLVEIPRGCWEVCAGLWTIQIRIEGWGRVVEGWYSSVRGGGFGGC